MASDSRAATNRAATNRAGNRPSSQRSSSRSDNRLVRFSELNLVRRELEKALRQVKQEMVNERGDEVINNGGNTERTDCSVAQTDCTFTTFSDPPSRSFLRPASAMSANATARHRQHTPPDWAAPNANAKFCSLARRPRMPRAGIETQEGKLPMPMPDDFASTLNEKHWHTMHRNDYPTPRRRPPSSHGVAKIDPSKHWNASKAYTKALDHSLESAFSLRGRKGLHNQERRPKAVLPFGERSSSFTNAGQVMTLLQKSHKSVLKS